MYQLPGSGQRLHRRRLVDAKVLTGAASPLVALYNLLNSIVSWAKGDPRRADGQDSARHTWWLAVAAAARRGWCWRRRRRVCGFPRLSVRLALQWQRTLACHRRSCKGFELPAI